MSITPHDLNSFTDQGPGNPRIRTQDISRIFRALSARRHPAATTVIGGGPVQPTRGRREAANEATSRTAQRADAIDTTSSKTS